MLQNHSTSSVDLLEEEGEMSSEGSAGHSGQEESISSVTQEIPETPSNGLLTSPPPPALHLTSTPVTANLSLHSSLQAEPYRSSAVKLSIFYPSKTVNKCLASEYEAIGKALIYGPPQRIVNAVVKSKSLTKHVVQSVLRLLSNGVCGLCSRSNPSLLRKCDRESLVNFSF